VTDTFERRRLLGARCCSDGRRYGATRRAQVCGDADGNGA
jgi:hypothetical protein